MISFNKNFFSKREAEILDQTSHRPFPLPANSWFIHQKWKNVLFLHWQLDAELIERYLPAHLKLDTFKGKGWITITCLEMDDVKLKNFPSIPSISSFYEVNVRTYVTYRNIPGLFYFSLDASSWLSVLGARWTSPLPYFNADIVSHKNPTGDTYIQSKRKSQPPAELILNYASTGNEIPVEKKSIDYWLLERYGIFIQVAGNAIHQIAMHHLPWKIREVNVDIKHNTMTFPLGLILDSKNTLFHFCQDQELFLWNDEKVKI